MRNTSLSWQHHKIRYNTAMIFREVAKQLDFPKIEHELDYDLELEEPQLFRVILHNDDYTSMDFVVDILVTIFHKTHAQAEQIMLQIHEKGKAICGVYTFEIAQTKAQQVCLKQGEHIRVRIQGLTSPISSGTLQVSSGYHLPRIKHSCIRQPAVHELTSISLE